MSDTLPSTHRTPFSRWNRREFLKVGSAGFLGLSFPWSPQREGTARSCIFLSLVGGPSQVDTFDPKPNAPSDVRSPFRSIRTRSAEIEITEIFPLTARQADKFSILRTMHHEAAAVHETGLELLQTGGLSATGCSLPHMGYVLSLRSGHARGFSPHFLITGECPRMDKDSLRPEGKSSAKRPVPHDPQAKIQSIPDSIKTTQCDRNLRDRVDLCIRGVEESGILETDQTTVQQAYSALSSRATREALDVSREPPRVLERYGNTRFGMGCLLCRRLIERGTVFVTVNMFDNVFRETTWDVHGTPPFPSLSAYRDTVGPVFDRAYSALLEDLEQRGLLESTLIVATGEFGRTPRRNASGGRDHWTRAWSLLLAGGGVQGGRVVGKTDEIGAFPVERAVSPQELLATVYHLFGMDPGTVFEDLVPEAEAQCVLRAQPIRELL